MVALEWQMAINWVRSTDIEPAKKQTLNKIDDLLEFAQSLRDGYILCLVANSLKPGTIKDISKVNNVNMHEVKFSSSTSHLFHTSQIAYFEELSICEYRTTKSENSKWQPNEQ